MMRPGRGRKGKGKGRAGQGRGRGRARGSGTEAKGRPAKRPPSEVSAATSEISGSESCETARIKKAKDLQKQATVKKQKKKQISEETDDEPCAAVEGLRNSSLGEYLQYVMNRVMNAEELSCWKKVAQAEHDIMYAEFCAGMATGTMAMETPRFLAFLTNLIKDSNCSGLMCLQPCSYRHARVFGYAMNWQRCSRKASSKHWLFTTSLCA